MKKRTKFFIGLITLAFFVGLNVRHALNDYGVKENKLHVEILAQTNTGTGTGTGDGGGSGSGSGGACSGCPSVDYAQDRTLVCGDPIQVQYTANVKGEIIVGGITLYGFKANALITIPVVIYNCSQESKCSCCDQKKIGPKPITFSWPS